MKEKVEIPFQSEMNRGLEYKPQSFLEEALRSGD